MAEVKFGIPQGSLLFPWLFAVQVNDLPKVSSKGILNTYANDICMNIFTLDHRFMK